MYQQVRSATFSQLQKTKSVFLWYRFQRDVHLSLKFRITFTWTRFLENSWPHDGDFPFTVRNGLQVLLSWHDPHDPHPQLCFTAFAHKRRVCAHRAARQWGGGMCRIARTRRFPTRARMHHKVVGNFESEADVRSLYFRGFRFNEISDNGACTHGWPAK